MKKINGLILSEHPFPDNEFVQDIIVYEQPILCLYKSGDRVFLYYWMDTNDIMDRWVIFETNKELLEKWRDNHYLFDIVGDYILNDEVYFVNLDKENKFVVGWKTNTEELLSYD